MSTIVRTQAELDAAIAEGASDIVISSPEGVWLTIWESAHVEARESAHVAAWGSAHVEARESAHVVARGSAHVVARGSAHVEAWGSAHVVAWESAHVVAWESAHVVAWGSAHVVAWGSAHVAAWGSAHVEAWGSTHVEAWESSHVVASSLVAVHLHSTRVRVEGGVVIDVAALELTDAATWCDFHGVSVVDDVATLFKALDDEFAAGHGYHPTTYTVGASMVCDDWTPTNDCGGGFHLGPTTSHATAYRPDAKRWVRVEVPLSDLRPILDGTPKCKARTCRVVAEVDRWGVDVPAEVTS